jgi:sodium-dependent dicarboxylate transporter 2/3/5
LWEREEGACRKTSALACRVASLREAQVASGELVSEAFFVPQRRRVCPPADLLIGQAMRKRGIGLVLGLVIFAVLLTRPAPAGMTPEAARAAAIALLMAIWWITEAIPIPATALLPLALYPLLGVMNGKVTAEAYGDHNVFLFMGGFFIAMAMQKWNLHKRIALSIISVVGDSPRTLVLGFMCATAFLSMWISNTATTMMMVPIAIAVLSQVPSGSRAGSFAPALTLGIAYSASIGGLGTLIGTPPNVIFAGAVEKLFPELGDIGFLTWMTAAVPLVAIFLPTTWLYLTRVVFKVPPGRDCKVGGGKVEVRKELAALGKMSRGERYTLTVFILTALAWTFRSNIDLGAFVIPGWSNLLGIADLVNDGTVAIFAAVVLFALPVDLKKGEFALDWEWASRIPWGVLLLFGGGFALAASFRATGLDNWVGGWLRAAAGLPPVLLIIIVCLVMTFLTEMTSNTATASMAMPVLGSTAAVTGMNPLILMIPATLSASCAFMLPVATPPNAIVFGTGSVTIPQMVRAGLGLNLIGVLLVTAVTYFIAVPVFGISW